MVKVFNNIFHEKNIDDILDLVEVKKAKESIDNIKGKYGGYILFSIEVPEDIQRIILDKFGLSVRNVPMRWVIGDSKPHVDIGDRNFNDTYLIYLTDSEGELLIEDISYPIKKNTGYVFSEGLIHETIDTGYNPRLLLGPISDYGFSVGLSLSYPGGTIVYLRQIGVGQPVEYSIDQVTWNILFWVCSIINSDTSLGMLIVEFTTDITLDNTIGGGGGYFACYSSHIQFGSTSLKNNGKRPVINVNGIDLYPGLISNGSEFSNGYDNIHIYNLDIQSSDSILRVNCGWFGQEYYGKSAVDCYIVNCNSSGPIIDAGGGIVGGFAGSLNGNLKILGCSSSGISGTYSGGIVGYFSAQSGGNVSCYSCFSTGVIGDRSGGIFGYNTGEDSGTSLASSCFSLGTITSNGGGIFGSKTINGVALRCYSKGNILSNAGGIFGNFSADLGGTCSAENCYSNGVITTSGNGIYGSNKNSGATQTNCYSSNGNWNSTTADSQLVGVPVSPNKVGTIWISFQTNEPYELVYIGNTPYSINNISITNEGIPVLVKTASDSVISGSRSMNAIIEGANNYTILNISGGNTNSYNTFNMNSNYGYISTNSNTLSGTYTFVVRNIIDEIYNISEFALTVTEPPVQSVFNYDSFRIIGNYMKHNRHLY